MARIVVREAETGDVSHVAELVARLKTLNEELDPHYKVVDNLLEVARAYAEEAIGDEKTRVLIALDEDAGEAAGILIYRLVDRRFYLPRIKAVITEFYVRPKYRRRRIGSLLLEKAIELARTDGAGMITAVYPAGNVLADSFYKARKFIELAVERYRPLA